MSCQSRFSTKGGKTSFDFAESVNGVQLAWNSSVVLLNIACEMVLEIACASSYMFSFLSSFDRSMFLSLLENCIYT